MIEVKGVTKNYRKKRAVDNLFLSVKKGSIYGLLGSNGAGKTSLLKMIAGIYRPLSGSITIDKEPVYENTFVKERIVFITDLLYFFPNYTIEQSAAYYKGMYPKWSDQRFSQLQNVFRLDLKQKVHRLSKGMKRQVSFWLALSSMPDVLILDEPIDGLDPVMRKKIKNLLFQEVAERELTVLISSHNLREIEDLCDYVGIMHKGKLMIEKDLDDLKADIHKVQVAFKNPGDEHVIDSLGVLHKEKRGSVILLIVKGNEHGIRKQLQKALRPFAAYVRRNFYL
jgi:ABC-2 type transport system ATP-binding protein